MTIPHYTGSIDLSDITSSNNYQNVYLLEAREQGGQVVLTYEVPKDSASVTFGALAHNGVTNDGRALCGSRSHQMTINGIQIGPQSNDQKIQSAKWLEFEYLPNGDPDVLV